MKGRFIILVSLLGLASGCRDDGPGAPQISSVSPDTIPYYLRGETLVVEGQSFLPQVSVRSREGGVDVTSDSFQVRLTPQGAPNGACQSGVVYLSDVTRGGTTELRGTLPEELCPGVYDVEVMDPRGSMSPEPATFVVSDSFPDHLRFFEGGCGDEGQPLDPISTSRELTPGEPHTFALKVVGPRGEAVSEMTPSLDGAAPLAQPVSLWLSTPDSEALFDLSSEPLRLQSEAAESVEEGGRLYAGTLSDEGCAEFSLSSNGPGSLSLNGTPESLPGLGNSPAAAVQLRFAAIPDQWLDISTPNRVAAGTPFDIFVSARVGRDEPRLDESLDGCLRFSIKDQAEASFTSNIADPLGCAEGTLPMVDGYAAASVTVKKQTPGTYIVAELTAASEVEGLSEVFVVDPGLESRLVVEPLGAVTAGERFELRVGLEDDFGNVIELQPGDDVALWYPGNDLTCEETQGDDATGQLIFPCSLTEAGEGQIISVNYASEDPSAGSLSTFTEPFDIKAGPLADIALGIPGSDGLTSGREFDLKVSAIDAFGNLVDTFGAVAVVPVGVPEEGYEIANTVMLNGTADVSVTVFPAGGSTLQVTFGDGLIQSIDINIAPGPHEAFSLATGADFPVEAGTSVGVTLHAIDAWGNTVTDIHGPVDLTFRDGDGEAVEVLSSPEFQGGIGGAVVRLTRAQEDGLLQAVDDLEREGTLLGVVVTPGEHVSFDFAFDYAVWVNRPFQARIRAVDAFGNLRADFQGEVFYTDRSDTLFPTTSGTFVDGVYTERFRIGQAIGDNALSVYYFPDGAEAENTALAISAESEPFPVLQDCPDELMVELKLLDLDNPDKSAHCLDEPFILGTRLEVEADVSFAGAGLSLRYLWAEDESSEGVRGGSSNTFTYHDPGHFRPSVTVWEPISLCGASDSKELFLGEDDHRPVGALTLVASKDPIYTDGASQGVTTITVEGQTCSRDNLPTDAEPFSIIAGTSYGVLEGLDTSSSLPGFQGIWNPTRNQVTYELDLSVVGQNQATTSRVAVGTPSGSAYGTLDISVLNDTFAPYVVSYGPSGEVEGPVSQAYVRFSEAMRPDSILDYGNVSVRVYEGLASERLVEGEDYTLSLVQGDSYLRINFEPALEIGSGVVEVELFSAGGSIIADAGGEALNGNWDALDTYDDSFRFSFGAMRDRQPPEVLRCAPMERVFSPVTYLDPDLAEGGLAFALSLRDDEQVSTWRLGIYGVADEPIYEMFGAASSSPTDDVVVEWFGNRTSGPMVPNGTYWYEVEAVDAFGNFSAIPCTGTVDIDNPFDFGMD